MNIFQRRNQTDTIHTWERELLLPISDRSSLIFPDRTIITPIPSNSTTASFASLCDARATELVALNKPIRIIYTGSVDSILVVASFLKLSTLNSPITILLTQSSIDSDVMFFQEHIVGMHVLQYRADEPYSDFVMQDDDGFILVTDELSDHLFGSFASMNALAEQSLLYVDVLQSEFISTLQPIIDIAPYTLSTTADLLWWVNFVMNYQYCQIRLFGIINIDFNRIHHFFGTTNFQQWCMSTPIIDRWPSLDFDTYKLDIREYIINFDESMTHVMLYNTDTVLNQIIRNIVSNHSPRLDIIDSSFNKIYDVDIPSLTTN